MAETETTSKEDSSFSDVFKNRNFLKLLVGQTFSNFGDAVFRISIVLYVYSLTESKTEMTLVLAAQTLPWILIGPISGVFADRISRKGIMVSSDILRAVSIIAIPFIHSLYPLLIIAFLDGMGSASFAAPRSAAIPEMVGLKLYVKAISISRLIFQTFAVLGPLIAAPVYAFFGPPTFWITSGCYILSGLVLFFTVIPSASREKASLTVKTVYSDLKEGIMFIFKHKIIKVIILLFTFLVIGSAFAGPLLYPWIFEIRYEGNLLLQEVAQTEYGIIGAIIALGTVMGSLLFGKFEKKIGRSRAIILGSFSLVIYYLLFLFTPSIYLVGVFGFMMGTLNGMMSLSINAYFAEEVPNEVRGRVYSATNAYVTIFSFSCLSISGLTADSIGIVYTMMMASIIIFLGVLFLTLRTKMFRFPKSAVQTIETVGD
ncbi:MAG: MFS transporter [Candidatus Heimdallarchaeaceae archaeon]